MSTGSCLHLGRILWRLRSSGGSRGYRFARMNETAKKGDAEPLAFVIDKDSETSVNEGRADVTFPGVKDVFYNPVQEFNRDLSISVLRMMALDAVQRRDPTQRQETFLEPGKVYEHGLTLLEALAASGLRSIRYAKEVGGLKSIVTNDISTSAVDSIRRNSKRNGTEHLMTPSEGDACIVMYQHRHRNRFDCVDLDPYGSPSPFLDAAVQCVADGGLLMVTATDMAVLCGNLPESCFAKYGSVSLKNKACHEMALRILLHAVQTSAARYGRFIHPLLSISVDFYVRLFIQVHVSKAECKSAASKSSMVYQCVNCHSVWWQPLMTSPAAGKYQRADGPPTTDRCEYCGGRIQLGGPFWSAPIHDQDFVTSLLASLDNENFKDTLKTESRIRGVLSVVREELADAPLYQALDRMSSFLKLTCPPMVQFRSALLNAGYRVSLSHCAKQSVKTDAPAGVLWDIMRCYARLQYPQRTWPRPLPAQNPSAADHLLSREPVLQADFTLHPQANPESRKLQLLRFQVNPHSNWGPKARAKSSVRKDSELEKRSRNQNKKRRFDDGAKEIASSLDE